MGILSKTRRGLVWLLGLKPDKWIDYHNLKQTTLYFVNLGRSVYHIPQASQGKTFEQAVESLQLTPTDLELQSKHFNFLAYFFSILALLILCYFFWLTLAGNFMGSVMTFAIMVYSFSLAFRYHFWHYQIQRRKLGCNTREYFRDLFHKKPKITAEAEKPNDLP